MILLLTVTARRYA